MRVGLIFWFVVTFIIYVRKVVLRAWTASGYVYTSRVMGRLTTSVSAAVANCASARYSSGVCTSLSLIAFSALVKASKASTTESCTIHTLSGSDCLPGRDWKEFESTRRRLLVARPSPSG